MTDDVGAASRHSRVVFHYIKANAFRVIHADGAIGGITPQGAIHFALFSERPAIPQMQEFEFTETGEPGEVVNQQGRPGIVRELDVDVVLSQATAARLRDWLTQKIDELERLRKGVGAEPEEGREQGNAT